jgi:hypothetical protein
MATDELFDSCLRSAGDLAGIFEYDGNTGYFYLYAIDGEETHKVLDSIHIFSGEPDFGGADISIGWDQNEQKVGLFIRGMLWAVFDCQHRAKYGGSYKPGLVPMLPPRATVGLVANAQRTKWTDE